MKQSFLLLCTGPLLVALGASSCARELPGETPPTAFYYPVGVARSPDEGFAYVVSSNFDLRFTSGWVSAINLPRVAKALAMGNTPSPAEVTDSQLNIPSLGGPIALNPEGTFAFVASRNVPVLTVIEISISEISTSEEASEDVVRVATLSCGDPGATADLSSAEKRTDCDRRHMFEFQDKDNREDPAWGSPALLEEEVRDPYAVTTFTSGGDTVVAVGFLTRDPNDEGLPGNILFFTLNTSNPDDPRLLIPRLRVFVGTANNSSGVADLAVRPDTSGTAGGPILLATSRRLQSADRYSTIYDINFARAELESPPGQASTFVTSIDPISTSIGGFEIASLVYAPSGNLAYIANTTPDGVAVIDTRLVSTQQTVDGVALTNVERPRDEVLSFINVEGQPTSLAYVSRSQGDVLAATSFNQDQIFLFQVRDETLVPAVRLGGVGEGPFAMAVLDRPDGSRFLLVTTFFDHGLSIIEIPPSDLQATQRLAQIRDPELGVASERR